MEKRDDWLLCAGWIDECGCLPEEQKKDLQSHRLKLSAFGTELAKGEMLCYLVSFLRPESIDAYRIVPNPNCEKAKSKHNVSLFLDVCRSAHFELDEASLFTFDDLYSRNLESVIYSLSVLSKCAGSAERGFGGFFFSRDDEEPTRISYIKLEEECDKGDEEDSDYCPIDFVIGNFEQENQAYLENIRNHDHVIREIMGTEETNNIMLDCLQNDFLLPLSKTLSYDDQKCISLNIEFLIKFHQALYFKLLHACQGGTGRSLRVANAFEELKLEFIKFYSDYFVNITCAIEKCISLINENKNKKANRLFNMTLAKCRANSQYGNYKLNELLIFPYQRILKYHLLLRELYVKSDTDAETKNALKKSWESMGEINSYLNECKRDLDDTNQIDALVKSLGMDARISNNATFKDFGRLVKKDERVGVKELYKNDSSFNYRTLILFQKKLIFFKGKNISHMTQLEIEEYEMEEYEGGRTTSRVGLFSSVLLENCILLRHVKITGQRIEFCFRNLDEKTAWKNCLDSIKKIDLQSSFHAFTLHNFARDIVACNFCNKLLLGIFFQGYKCNLCGYNAHLNCVGLAEHCKFKTQQGSQFKQIVHIEKVKMISKRNNEPEGARGDKHKSERVERNSQPNLARNTLRPNQKLSSINDEEIVYSSLKFVAFKAVADSKTGESEPVLPSTELPILEFKKNEFVYVTGTIDAHWYRGFKLRFKCAFDKTDHFKEDGAFLKKLVKKSDPRMDYAANSWYIETDRNSGTAILNSIPDNGLGALFMVRYKSDGGFSLSIKHAGQVGHIKIQVNEIEVNKMYQVDKSECPLESIKVFKKTMPSDDYIESVEVSEKKTFYSIDSSFFTSLGDLVQFFRLKSLNDTFKLNTCLGTPYREALPTPIHTAVALSSYDPKTAGYIALKKLGFYFVITDFEDKYLVYNEDGLTGWTVKIELKIIS